MESKEPKLRYEGHTDFVRSVISTRLQGQDVLVSGGADAQLIVFDIATGQRLAVMKGHAKGIQDLALDPVSLDSDSPELIVFSAGSDRQIRQFDLSTGSKDLTGTEALLAHDTNVHKLFFDRDADLWTASADKTSKCLVREDGWKPNLTLTHPDYVRDVVVYEQGGWVVTACRDEEVRVWNRSVRTYNQYHTTIFFLCRGNSTNIYTFYWTDRAALPYLLRPLRRGYGAGASRIDCRQRQYRCHYSPMVLETR